MTENTKIEWCDHTFNPWVGCTKVSPACDHCYAEGWAKRTGLPQLWAGELRRTSAANWRLPLKWDIEAEASGIRRKVFCASLDDVFDNQAPERWRADLWSLIAETPHLDWLLLTKRPQNIAKMLPSQAAGHPEWGEGWPNAWLGTTVENQTEADRRIPHLLAIPAAIRFLSCEPLLGSVELRHLRQYNAQGKPWIDALTGIVTRGQYLARSPNECSMNVSAQIPGELPRLDWVICGGESGPKARPMHPDWARSLRDQCAAAGVPFFFKQWGEWLTVYDRDVDDPDWRNCPQATSIRERYVNIVGGHGFHNDRVVFARRIGKTAAGRHLDGEIHDAFPIARKDAAE